MTGVDRVVLAPLGGMSGDMFVAAMLDALPDQVAPVLAAVRRVLPGDPPQLTEALTGGIAARRFHVPPQGAAAPMHYPDLDARIAGAALPGAVAGNARAILRVLAEAEAAVHRLPVAQVHFHEIADWDTVADAVAAGHLIAHLAGADWHVGPLPMGGGTVQTAHGLLPVPAPAAARLMAGLVLCDDGIPGERVTPTGAAIARHLANLSPGAASGRQGRLLATGYGAGSRSLPGIANLLCVHLLSVDVAEGTEQVVLIEFDVDDMTAEEIATAADRLRDTQGVADVVTHPVAGKKGRIATAFRLIVRPGSEPAVIAACFAQTATIGLRLRREGRVCLPRASVAGQPRVKQVMRPGGGHTAKAEADDLTGATLADRRRMARKAEK